MADQLRAQDPSVAAQLGVAGYRIAPTPQATASLLDPRGLVRHADPGLGGARAVGRAQPGPPAAGRGGRGWHAALWNVAAPGHPVEVATLARANKAVPLYTAAFSPDGRVIAAAGAGKS